MILIQLIAMKIYDEKQREDHGGYIWATSKEGIGTTIHFCLRKYQEAVEDE